MKKSCLFVIFIAVFCIFGIACAKEELTFPQALKTCETYSQNGSAAHQNTTFNLNISLEKKANKCVYKEKISLGKEYELLTCNFSMSDLEAMSKYMQDYNNVFKNEIAKNKIFGAKMTSNALVFQKYIADPKNCQITHSKKGLTP